MSGAECYGSAHFQFRNKLSLFEQFQPVIFYPHLDNFFTLKTDVVASIYVMVVRDISTCTLGRVSGGEELVSQISYTA